MEQCLYRSEGMERELSDKLDRLIADRFGQDIPPEVADRVATEKRHIFENGYGTLLAVTAKLAAFMKGRGYPVGSRGSTGSLYLSYLLGLTAVDPMLLGLRWESCLGLSGNWMPGFTLNVAEELLDDVKAYLTALLPECDVLDLPFDLPASPRKILMVPKASGEYRPERKYLSVTLCSHRLISMLGEALRNSDVIPKDEDIFDEALIVRAYRDNVSGIPVLSDLDGLQKFARQLEPKTFPDLVKLMGLCLAPDVWFQAEQLTSQGDPFAELVGTREDLYDICVRHGIEEQDAFRIMRQAGCGDHRLTPEYEALLADAGLSDPFRRTAAIGPYLYPRCQCADYLYRALTLLKLRLK